MTYQDQLEEAASSATAQVLAGLAAYEAGQLTADALVSVVAAYIAAASSGAAALADLSLAAAVSVQTGTPAAPLGITRPADEADRLASAAQTILDDLDRARSEVEPLSEAAQEALDTAQMRYERLVHGEVKKAAARAYSEAVAENKAVTGWTRGLKPDACQLCQWWSRGGKVWAADHEMPTHTGCTCSQIITTTERNAS